MYYLFSYRHAYEGNSVVVWKTMKTSTLSFTQSIKNENVGVRTVLIQAWNYK